MTRAHAALRGWLFALCSAALAITAHGMAGGGRPDTALTILLTVLIAWAGTAVADRLRGVVTMLAVLGITQVGLHLLLTDIAGQHDQHAGHGQSAPTVTGWAMVAAHAGATAVTAMLLTRASTSLAALSASLRWLLRRVDVLCSAPIAAPSAIGGATTAPQRPGHLLEVLLRRVSSRRGPPVFS